MELNVNALFEELGNLPQVEAVALGGSRATQRWDETSDYDVYIYITDPIPESDRKAILEKYFPFKIVENTY